ATRLAGRFGRPSGMQQFAATRFAGRFAGRPSGMQQFAATRFAGKWGSHPGSVLPGHPGTSNWANHWCRFGRCNGFRPYIYGAPAVASAYAAAPAYAAPAPAYAAAPAQTYAATPAATTCLKKEYTQNGQVVFSDVCTNESLAGPIGSQVQ